MQYVLTVPFYLGGPPDEEDENGCWIGIPTQFELLLLRPQASYALEQLRLRFLYFVTTTHNQIRSARVTLQMGFETELQAAIAKLILLPTGALRSKVCERRRFIDIDRDLQQYRYLINPAISALDDIPAIPDTYIELIRRYSVAEYPRYRVCALATMLCMAAAVAPL
jgi:hypothetical protein